MSTQQPTLALLSTSLKSLSLPPLTTQFLSTILPPTNPSSSSSSSSSTTTTTSRPSPPLPALLATTKHRLLTLDISLPPSPIHPSAPALTPQILSPQTPALLLPSDQFLQVIDIEDINLSKWEQLSMLERESRGEFTKGREIIRIPPPDPSIVSSSSSSSTQTIPPPQSTTTQSSQPPNSKLADSRGPFKLSLQDHKGNSIYAFESSKVARIGFPPTMGIGCKVVVRKGTRVARGMILLLGEKDILVLGGRVEGMEKIWKEGLEGRLRKGVGGEGGGGE